MGYFDGIAQRSFNTDERGRQIFFPFGKTGKGYVMETDAQYEDCLSFARHRIMVTLALVIVTVGVLQIEMTYVIGVIALVAGVDYLLVKTKVRNYTVATSSFDSKQFQTRSVRTIGLPWLIICEAIAVLFVLLGLFILPKDPVVGGIGIAFFGFCAFNGARMIKQALDHKQ